MLGENKVPFGLLLFDVVGISLRTVIIITSPSFAILDCITASLANAHTILALCSSHPYLFLVYHTIAMPMLA